VPGLADCASAGPGAHAFAACLATTTWVNLRDLRRLRGREQRARADRWQLEPPGFREFFL